MYGTASKTHSGKESGDRRREAGRIQNKTKQNKPTQKVLMENGELGDLGIPMPPPRSNNQRCILSVIPFSKNDIPRRKAASPQLTNQTGAFLEINHHTLAYSTGAGCEFAFLSHRILEKCVQEMRINQISNLLPLP